MPNPLKIEQPARDAAWIVTQADRGAAAELTRLCNPDEAKWIVPFYEKGGNSPLAEALAKHRLAERERCARVAESHADDRPRRDGIDWNDGYLDGCLGAATAIRNSGERE